MLENMKKVLQHYGGDSHLKNFCYLTFSMHAVQSYLTVEEPNCIKCFVNYGANFELVNGADDLSIVQEPHTSALVYPSHYGPDPHLRYVYNYIHRMALRFLSIENWPSVFFVFKNQQNEFYFSSCFVPKTSRRLKLAVQKIKGSNVAFKIEQLDSCFKMLLENKSNLENITVKTIGCLEVDFSVEIENVYKFNIKV